MGSIFSTFPLHAQLTGHPNIVFILVDDFGYSSLNCYGADQALVRTLHINRIAERGMKFTNAYTAASVCSPTRYSFIMGRYPSRSELKYGVWGVESRMLPDPDKVTIEDWLKERGYHTAVIGKWHLGYGSTGTLEEYTGTLKPSPLDLGFYYHFGVPQNHGDKMGVYIENDHIYGIRSDKIVAYSRTFYGPQYYGFDAPQRKHIECMEMLTEITPDSYSFYPVLVGTKDRKARIFVVTADMHGMQAIRSGDWKYIDNTLPEELPEARRKRIYKPLERQLYNLKEDPYESNNLANTYPEMVTELMEELARIRFY